MQKIKFSVKIPDLDYWKKQIKCQYACPVHTDARGYVRAIAEGNFEKAYLIARGPNPLASICSRVCGAPCESSCRRNDYDQPLAIRALKRFICDRYGSFSEGRNSKEHFAYLRKTAAKYVPYQCQDKEEFLPFMQSLMRGDIPKVEGKSVGIIGSGPSGLAAAHDLALMGFSVTVYEMEPILGGMLSVGIPEYRLPRDLIAAEVDSILSLGVKAITNCCVGKELSFAELRQRHDTVIIAVGAKRSRTAPYPGADAQGVIGGVEFLRDVALGNPPPLGRRVVVVGGGDAAMDSARSALRVTDTFKTEEQGESYLALDAALMASRLGDREINIVYRRSRAEMPAVETEIYETDEEGVRFHLLTNPVSIEKTEQGTVKGIWCQKMALGEIDSSGRRQPVPIEGSKFFMACDNVIVAIGQSFDLSFIDARSDGIPMTDNGLIDCDPVSGSTAAPDVFVAGDLAHGPKLLIDAVSSGKAVARRIYEKTTGNHISFADVELHFPLTSYERETGYENQHRVTLPTVPIEKRSGNIKHPVELGFSTQQALREAERCFDCGVNTIFDGQRCVLCGGCVDICPENCLQIVPLDQLADDGSLHELFSRQPDGIASEITSAIIKDGTICIRCGLCAERCPTDAITMEQLSCKSNVSAGNTGVEPD